MRTFRRVGSPSLVLAALTCVVVEAKAQVTAGVFTGRVVDASSQQAQADVVVTVTSASLQGEQIAVTDAKGFYRIPNLPPGSYAIRFDKDGFKPFALSEILVRAGATLQIDGGLRPEGMQSEEIVVTGRAPTVDATSSSISLTIDAKTAERVPLIRPSSRGAATRSIESVAEMAPGAQGDTYGVSFNGASSPENAYQIDGLSVGNTAYGILGSPLSIEFVKEVNVITGGYLPEYGRSTGGILSAVTNSGSNEVSGHWWGQYSPGALNGPRNSVPSSATVIQTKTNLAHMATLGADVGGPIIKDALWYYAGVQLSETKWTLDRSVNPFTIGSDGEQSTDSDGAPFSTQQVAAKRYSALGRDIQAIAKLTWQADKENRIALTFAATPRFSGGNGKFGIDPQTDSAEVGNIIGNFDSLAMKYKAGSYDTTLKWTSDFDNKRALLETTVGYHREVGSRLPTDGSTIGGGGLAATPGVVWRRSNPRNHSILDFETSPELVAACSDPQSATKSSQMRCPVNNYYTGGPGYMEDSVLDRVSMRTMGTYFLELLGHHVIKAGVDYELAGYDHTKAYSGTDVFRESSRGTLYSDYRQFGYLTDPDTAVILDKLRIKTSSHTIGGFVQDSWKVMDLFTINVGVRYDAQYLYNGNSELKIALPNQWAPRAGIVWDPTNEGRMKVFANYSRFYQQVSLDIADRAASGEPSILSYHQVSSTCNLSGDSLTNPACNAGNRVANPANGSSTPSSKWQLNGAGVTPVDPNLVPQSSDEIVAGAETELSAISLKNARAGVTGTMRWYNDVIEDMSNDEASTYFIGNPGKGIASSFPKATRDYRALTAYLQKAFSSDWFLQASYTLSELKGNYAGLVRPETGQLDPNITSSFDLKSLLANNTGLLPGNTTHSIKVYGSYDYKIDEVQHVNVGGAYRSSSGSPFGYLGSHPLYGPGEVQILPRGTAGETPWFNSFDMNFAYGFKPMKAVDLSITADIFNLINLQSATSVDETYTTADVQPIIGGSKADLPVKTTPVAAYNPGQLKNADGTPIAEADVNANHGRPNSYQSPRQFRFGIRGTF